MMASTHKFDMLCKPLFKKLGIHWPKTLKKKGPMVRTLYCTLDVKCGPLISLSSTKSLFSADFRLIRSESPKEGRKGSVIYPKTRRESQRVKSKKSKFKKSQDGYFGQDRRDREGDCQNSEEQRYRRVTLVNKHRFVTFYFICLFQPPNTIWERWRPNSQNIVLSCWNRREKRAKKAKGSTCSSPAMPASPWSASPRWESPPCWAPSPRRSPSRPRTSSRRWPASRGSSSTREQTYSCSICRESLKVI